MAGFCLPKFAADALKTKFKNGEISPEKLSDMTSTERRKVFEFLGEENAKQTNALFESKLLLKNQQLGMVNWAKQILKLKPETLRDTLSKVEKMNEVLSPKELDMFLEDLVEKKLGFSVSVQDAGKLIDLSKKVETYKKPLTENTPNGSPEAMKYGSALTVFKDYVENLKQNTAQKSIWQRMGSEGIEFVNGITKVVLATLDNSLWGRQAWKLVLDGHYDIWARNFMKSWGDIVKELKGEDAMLPIKADVYSRQYARNGAYNAQKLAIGLLSEEAFPPSFLTKIPGLGRLFKASETAYNGGALRVRADLADKLFKNAERNGVDLFDKTETGLGEMINSMTGRGSLGRLEPVARPLNVALWSARFLKSNIDALTAHQFTNVSQYTKVQARYNLVKTALTISSVLTIAEIIQPGSADLDPRSADFGKIKIGNTRFDITGGMASLVTLAFRIAVPTTHNGKLSLWMKSSTTGKYTDLLSGKYGATNPFDVLTDFAHGKTSPLVNAVISFWKQRNFLGKKPTIPSTLSNLFTPMPIKTYQELMNDPKSADLLISMILSEVGIGVNTYGKK